MAVHQQGQHRFGYIPVPPPLPDNSFHKNHALKVKLAAIECGDLVLEPADAECRHAGSSCYVGFTLIFALGCM